MFQYISVNLIIMDKKLQLRKMEATNSSLPSAAKERQYSDNISRRRKGLFQSDGDMFKTNNELGLINTLNDAVGYLEGTVDKETSLHSLEDYIIYDRIEVSTPKGRSLISSPYQTIISETPLKQSPSEKLKTPNDSYSHNEKIPKLIRKSLLDTSFSEANNQNLTTPISSPKSKSEGSLVKSKVCTALFPDDMALPVKSFYPKTTDNRIERFHHDVITNVQKPTHKPKVSYICNRRRIKNCFGQINAGVRHKIKKPKNKNSRKDQIMKAVENIIENSPLNEYLEGIAKLKLQKDATRQQTIKMETTVKETQKLQNPFRSQENRNTFHIRREIKKRAHSPDSGEENRKFFKSSRSRAVVTLNTNIKVEIDYGLRENDVSNEKISFDLTENLAVPEDFNSGCSINRILNILENDEAKESLNNPSPSFQNFLLSPTSEMCDLTSGLAINSPSKAKLNINPILDRCLTSNTLPKASDLETQKLFPMFYPNHKTQPDKKETSAVNSNLKNWKQLPKDQLLLDAGQKRFGATQCPVCKIVYHMGDPNDELMHKSYHEAGHILRFNVSTLIIILMLLGFLPFPAS